MTTPSESAVALGARRARQYLALADAGRSGPADFVLGVVSDPQELLAVGAGLTALARMTGRMLPPGLRAQAAARQQALGRLRDTSGADADALRDWLRRAGAEALAVARLAEPDAAARRLLLDPPAPS